MNLKKPHKDIKLKNDSGFTLIEVLIAMGIFAIGFLAVGLMQINALNTTNSARRITEAMALAENQAEIFRALPFYDDDQDLDATGGVDPFDILPVFDPTGNPYTVNSPGPYTVRWTVDDTLPLPGYSAGVLGANRVPNSMMIRIWVTPDNAATETLAEIEFAKFCGKAI